MALRGVAVVSVLEIPFMKISKDEFFKSVTRGILVCRQAYWPGLWFWLQP